MTSFVVDMNTSFLTQGGSGIKEMIHSMEWGVDGQEMPEQESYASSA